MIQAFRLSGVEYLLKPVNPVELTAAVCHAAESDQEYLNLQLKALNANVRRY